MHRVGGAWHDLAFDPRHAQPPLLRQHARARHHLGALVVAARRRRTIRLGSYDARENLIRVHPALDQSWVPRLFVEAVVYHEMLHALMPAKESGGRRCLHGPEFRRRERQLPGVRRRGVVARANVHRLLRSRPRR